LHKNSDNND